jgi:alpha-mannosidase
VLDLLETDERFVFTLDGQLVVIDDYLEVRPEAEERIRRFVAEGRLAIGPWYTLVDEFLVSGEAILRNLERGLARGDELGGAMRIGYLPDMFGHVAQMPQILRLAGIDQALVWRGVPTAIDRHAFLWQAPNGSEVRAEYLPRGYGNAADVFAEPERVAETLEGLREALKPFYGDDPILAMYGNDHTEPDRATTDLVETTRERIEIELKTLPECLDSVRPAELPRWAGELRSGARANLLMGVTSARIDLKIAAARAERALERYAEPLQALFGGEWPERLLDVAWQRVLENSAHDSICGCSTDEVSAQVLVRYAEAEQIARGLADEAVRNVARFVARSSVAVVNPLPFARTGVVELPDGRLAQATVPPLGWASVTGEEDSVEHPVRAVDGTGLTNGLLDVELEDPGTLTIRGGGRELSGVGRVVEGRDVGDSYNYAPPPDDVLVDQPDHVSVEIAAGGPLRGELQIVRAFTWKGVEIETTTLVELRAGEHFCRLRVSFDNRVSDHRVRLHIALADPADRSVAEGQFAVVERGLEAEGGHGEVPLPTFPARGFVDAGGVAVLLDHVMEYELLEGRELALTLLRSIGLISRADNPYREVNAGPEVPIPAAQLRGPWSIVFALFPHSGSWLEAGVLRQMEHYQHPLLAAQGTGERAQVPERAGPELRGEGVVLSALRRRGDRLEARIVNEQPRAATATLAGQAVDLRPWEIRTVSVPAGPADALAQTELV